MEIMFSVPLWGLIAIGIAIGLACIACIGLEVALLRGAQEGDKIRWQNIVIMAVIGIPAAIGALEMLAIKILRWTFKILSWVFKYISAFFEKIWDVVMYLASNMRQVKTAPEPQESPVIADPQTA
jgi:hypothetical protein